MLIAALRNVQVKVAHQAADALRRLHAVGIAHRDVSPSTLALSPTGVIHLTSLGISHLLTHTLRAAHPNNSSHPAYCAPEATDDDAPLTDRADTWSLAAVLLAIITGREPYAGRSVNQIIRAHMRGWAPQVQEGGLIPPDLVALLRRCFAPIPSQRPSCAQVCQSDYVVSVLLCRQCSAALLIQQSVQ